MVKHAKPKSFYKTFERKGPGQETTHYCPGCGHGTVHKLIAEAIDEFGVQDRTIFCSPVGCSVFGYYYFDTGNIQCAHGRAPAVATGLRRTHDNAIIISYQGDGDLAGIGTAEIIHAANRGENISVYFVNNAIYGMTGGQMAPTTLLGQRTMTTPAGRSLGRDGNPIGMAELLSSLVTPVYVERVSLADGAKTMKTRKAVRKALKNQIEGRGFSFVEIISPCPVNWKMTAADARTWIVENLEPVFPPKLFVDRTSQAVAAERGVMPGCPDPDDAFDDELEDSATAGANGRIARTGSQGNGDGPARSVTPGAVDRPVAQMDDDALRALLSSRHDIEPTEPTGAVAEQRVKIAGFGGQGVLSAGVLLANCAVQSGLHATWLPSYGPEMRGGTANASVIVSGENIGSPLVDYPTTLIAMNGPSFDAFEQSVEPGGLIIANSSIIARRPTRSDIRFFAIPASDIAKEIGFIGAANVILLTVYASLEGFPEVDVIRQVIPYSLKKKEMVSLNMKMMDAALSYLREHRPETGAGGLSGNASADAAGFHGNAQAESPKNAARASSGEA